MGDRKAASRYSRRGYVKGVGVATLGVSGLAGCSSQQQGSQTSEGGTMEESGTTGGTFDYWNMDMPSARPLGEEGIKTFEEKHNVSLNATRFPFGNYPGKLSSAIASGDAPAISGMNIRWLPRFAESGQVVSLSERGFSKDTFIDAQHPNLVYGDEIHTITWFSNYRQLLINKQHFRDAGLEVPDPDHVPTWDEFAEWVEALTTDDHVGYVANSGRSYQSWTMSNGGNMLNDTLNPTDTGLDSEESIETLAFLRDLVEKGQYEALTKYVFPEALQSFTNGNASIMFGGNWFISLMKEDYPEIDFQFLPVPVGPSGGDLPRVWVAGPGWAVPSEKAGNENVEIGVEWMKHISSVEHQLKVAPLAGSMPVRKEVYETDEWKNYEEDNPLLKTARVMQKEAVAIPHHSNWSEMERALISNVQACYEGNKTPDEAMKDAASTIRDIL